MNVNFSNNVSFGAILGKREITYNHGLNKDGGSIVQHIYPFKDEFLSTNDKKELAASVEKSTYLNRIVEGLFPKFPIPLKKEAVIEKPLPFTKAEFILAQQYPAAAEVSEEALKFINSKEFATTTIKDTGYFPPKFVE